MYIFTTYFYSSSVYMCTYVRMYIYTMIDMIPPYMPFDNIHQYHLNVIHTYYDSCIFIVHDIIYTIFYYLHVQWFTSIPFNLCNDSHVDPLNLLHIFASINICTIKYRQCVHTYICKTKYCQRVFIYFIVHM